MQDHIMIDIETLGTTPGSVITSIGFVRFNLEGIIIADEVGIDITSSLNHGCTVDGETIKWWMKQSDSARSTFNSHKVFHPANALAILANFIKASEDVLVWGNGATFDLVLLADMYRKVGFNTPWGHRQERCFRTLKALCPHITDEAEEPGKYVSHNALHDALRQAEHAIRILTYLENERAL